MLPPICTIVMQKRSPCAIDAQKSDRADYAELNKTRLNCTKEKNKQIKMQRLKTAVAQWVVCKSKRCRKADKTVVFKGQVACVRGYQMLL